MLLAAATLYIALHRRTLVLLFDVPSSSCRLERKGHVVLRAPCHAVRGASVRRVKIGRHAGNQAEVQLLFDAGHVRVALFVDESQARAFAARLTGLTGAEPAAPWR